MSVLERTLCVLAIGCVAGGGARAAVLTVAPDGSGDHPTIQAAIDSANDGDVVELTDGTFTGDGNRDIRLRGKAITVRSASGEPATCVIDAEATAKDKHRCFVIHEEEGPGTRIEGLTLTGGVAPDTPPSGGEPKGKGGGLFIILSSPTIERCVIRGNRAESGGGIYAGGSSSTIRECVVEGNVAELESGGGFLIDGPGELEVVDTLIRGNEAGLGGGGLGGGVAHIASDASYLRNCVIIGNSAQLGGGVFSNLTVTHLVGCTVSANQATDGGGLYVGFSSMWVDRSIVSGDCASGEGDDAHVHKHGLAFSCSAVDPARTATWDDQGGIIYTDEPVTADPRLCEPASCTSAPTAAGCYAIASNSPCTASNSPCGEQIGAIGVGCDAIPIEELSWGALKSRF